MTRWNPPVRGTSIHVCTATPMPETARWQSNAAPRPRRHAPGAMRNQLTDASIPLAVNGETGHLRLITRQHICHGYANCCVCPDCLKREKQARDGKPPEPKQPWELPREAA